MIRIHDPCESCGAPVVQRDGERIDKWRARRTCSRKCLGRLQSLLMAGRSIERGDDPHPPCPICRRPIERREDETRWNFGKRQTCGEMCHAALQRQRAGEPLSLRDRRHVAGISRDALAREAGVCDRTVSFVEAGRKLPQAEPKIIAALARLEAIAGVGNADPGWPKRTGNKLPAGCFRAHNLPAISLGLGRVFQPATHVKTQANS